MECKIYIQLERHHWVVGLEKRHGKEVVDFVKLEKPIQLRHFDKSNLEKYFKA
jgi:hypothetical protein